MDLLGSILSTMDKPPEVDEKQKELIKSTYDNQSIDIDDLANFSSSSNY